MKSKLNRKRRLIFLAGTITVITIVLLGLTIYYSQTNSNNLPFIFAFASDRSGAGDIFVLDPQGHLQNVSNHPAADWNPVWSPDGRWLAFTSHRAGNSDIWLLDMYDLQAEGQPRNVTEDAAWDYSPTWSPSGQSIAFVSERDGDAEIFIQNLAEKTAIQLTFNEEMDRRPAWSPDGKRIAFAGVRGGVEHIYVIRPDGTDEQIITRQPVSGSSPAWSPDSQRLAFIGWDEENRAGIYIIGPTPDYVSHIYQSERWLGSLAWSADGEWLTFTAWDSGNHDVYALSLTGDSRPVRLTINQAWDDFLVINPLADFAAKPSSGIAQAAPALKLPPQPEFASGVNMADLGLAYLVNDMGFDWAKGYINWATIEAERGQFRWVDADNVAEAYGDQHLKILMRVHGTPEWARPADSHYTYPPHNLADFANFMTALATRYKGQVAGYEIWNEPNLNYEWGYLEPDPVAYTEMLKVAYEAVKAVDPEALVISGGLATTGDGSANAYGDVAFLEGMYQAGAKGYFDALGSHPYPYGLAPDESHPDGLSLDRVLDHRAVMLAYDDGETPIWITEVGWVLQANWDLGEHQVIGVSEAEQGVYLARSYAKVQEEWPFVQGMFLFNLDFSTVSWYPAPEPMRWYAILNPDRTPRPAYTLLRQAARER